MSQFRPRHIRQGLWGFLHCTLLMQATAANAQDSHYNTELYGDRSTLLGGAVVASVDDPSAAFYNPGALADISPKDVFLGTKVFYFTLITIQKGSTDIRIDSDDFGKAPSFVGGMIPIDLGAHRIAYSVFKRAYFGLRISETGVDYAPLIGVNDITSNSLSARIDAKVNDDWVGLSWATAVSSRLRLGLTMFGSYRSHRFGVQRIGEFFRSDGQLTTVVTAYEYKYGYLSLLWKLGVKYKYGDHLDFGLAVATPNVGLGMFSDGRTYANLSRSGAAQTGPPTSVDLYAADQQEKLNARYRSPFTVGVGASYSFRELTIQGSIDWYGKVDRYDVLSPEPFIAQSTGDTLQQSLIGGTESVVNFSLGLEDRLSPSVIAFLGFRTDFSAKPRDEPESIYFTNWDLYHVSGGTQFAFGVARVTLGGGFSFGSENSDRYDPIQDLVNLEGIESEEPQTTVTFNRFNFVVGFGLRN